MAMNNTDINKMLIVMSSLDERITNLEKNLTKILFELMEIKGMNGKEELLKEEECVKCKRGTCNGVHKTGFFF